MVGCERATHDSQYRSQAAVAYACFENLRCIRVAIVTDVLNQQSQKAILRLGAQQEGTLRNHMIMPGGRYRDSVCFSIIEAEWPEVKAKLAAKLRQKADAVTQQNQ